MSANQVDYIPASILAELSKLGTTVMIGGVVMIVPTEVSYKTLFQAGETLNRMGHERYLCETADQGGT